MLTPKTSQQTLCNSSTYYTQNQWCAGNSNLTAANIKKDITIFGVKGTYYESKRYLIQNGVLTGLCTMEYIPLYDTIGSLPTKTINWNNSSWYFLQGHESIDWSIQYGACTVFRGIQNLVKTSWSGTTSQSSAASAIQFGGRLYGDILMEGLGWAANAYYWACITIGGTGTSWLSSIRIANTGLYPPSGEYDVEYSTASIPAPNAPRVMSGSDSYNTKITSKDVVIGFKQVNIATSWGTQERTNFWVKNLWIDTSTTTSTVN